MNIPRPLRVCNLWIPRMISTDPPLMKPSIRGEILRGGGVPTEPIMIVMEEGIVIWEPSGEVRTVRAARRPGERKEP